MGRMMALLPFKYVHCTENRHGKKYYSFRKAGMKRIRLPDPNSKEFSDAYRQCLEESPPKLPVNSHKVKPGSMKALAMAWFESGDFKKLAKSTQVTYRGIIDRFLASHSPNSTVTHGEKPVNRMERKHIKKIIGDMWETPAAANNLLIRLQQLMAFGLDNYWIKTDPTQGVKRLSYKVKGFYSWTEADAAKFVAYHKPGTKPHLAFMILSNTGLRRSDVVKLGRGNRRSTVGEVDCHVVEQTKTGDVVIIPLHPALEAELESIKGRFLYLQTEYGKPFTAAGFGNWMRDRCDEAGLPDCASHGLRKLVATRLAEALCSESQISAILGWRNNKQASVYTKAANRERMARAGMKAIG